MVQLSSILSKSKRMTSLLFSRKGDRRAFRQSLEKVFTRTLIREHNGLEGDLDAKCALNRSQHFFRRFDDRKKERMVKLFSSKLEQIFTEQAEFRQALVVLSKVEVPTVFSSLKVFWRSYGDNRDQTISEILEEYSSDIRQSLSYELCGSTMPPLVFYPDRSQMYVEKMDALFEKADYGADYKPLITPFLNSPASLQEERISTDKVPKFVQKLRRHVERKKEGRERKDT